MAIDGVKSIDVNPPTQGYGKQSLGQEDFMRLLLQELANQDLLNPMDSKEFTVQMTQFSTLEGINKMTQSMAGIDDINLNLQNLLDYQQSMQNATVTNMIGKTVKMDGSFSHLGQTAAMNYDLPEDAAAVRITIKNTAGNLVSNREHFEFTAENREHACMLCGVPTDLSAGQRQGFHNFFEVTDFECDVSTEDDPIEVDLQQTGDFTILRRVSLQRG